ncbi:hypothetical protein [Shewanella surugensis]|uniref:Gp5/Type VI secretion system Vgr protein OB-fold domain-containing protein n=1 Tax=Shewanella surugensis TaxID=212020 RepID=A0ABT0L779_9GAMM|nr:hypothetical protein [Shewanella surugensis]MCL1123515.1 hypothetical protein [Shewanella surugensis]
MKLTKRLTIGSTIYPLSDYRLVLELSAGGRGIFETVTSKLGALKHGQIVSLDIGYNNQLQRYFSGYISKVTQSANGSTRFSVRELSGILAERMPMSILHATFRQVITQLSTLSGLSFVILESADYVDKPIANFTSQGTGYQLLKNVARAFNVPEFVWYQQQNGQIFVGGYQDSRWANRPVDIPSRFSQQQNSNSWQLLAMPSMRPGVLVNGHRVKQVEFNDDTMTLTWTATKADDLAEERKITNIFPELAGGYHLPRFAKVMSISDTSKAGDLNNAFRPRYAVDVQLLDENNQPDLTVPIYRAVPLPMMFGGNEQGLLQYPSPGTLVEIGFAYGRPDKAFIRTVLGCDWALPNITPGEQLIQQRAEVYQRTDSAGNQICSTDQKQIDISYRKQITSDEYQLNAGSSHTKVAQHSIEEVGAKKTIEALGAIELLAGDNINLASLGNMHFTTTGELVEVVGKLRRSVASQMQKMEAPTHWAGTDTINIYALLDNLMQCVEQLADHCAGHTHEYDKPLHKDGTTQSKAPNLATNMSERKSQANELHNQLNPLLASADT